LLDQMLAALGLSRQAGPPQQQVYIANTLKCRPPRNRNPDPAELQQCQSYLLRQVELVQPRVVLAMGRFAVQSLLGSTEPIGRLRGRVHRWRERPLVVTYHPAYLLRNPADKARAWADLCLAAQVLRAAGA
jgi:uracil-DNA glycosylase family 4